MFAHVTFPISSFQTFTYVIPDVLRDQVVPGVCVDAPMGRKFMSGYVVAVDENPGFSGKIKELYKIHDMEFHLPKELWQTLEWMSRYYITPLGQVLRAAIPHSFQDPYQPKLVKYISITNKGHDALNGWCKNAPAQFEMLNALSTVNEPVRLTAFSDIASSPHTVCIALEKQGWVNVFQQPKIYDPFDLMAPGSPTNIKLSPAQNEVYEPIFKTLSQNKFSPFLLHGITGSGKTEVYLKLAQQAVSQNKTVLVLVPEISLTPQVATRFRRAFGARVALWHSRMTKAEKGWTWQQLKKGAYSVVVGARSALFAPLNNLGFIIVDEEQEASYKQEAPAPRYHARDVALIRGKNAGASVLLTSATPSLESYYNAITGKLKLIKLTQRFANAIYPSVKLVDMKNQMDKGGQVSLISGQLQEAIQGCLDKKEQVILLQNRRGFSLIQQCRSCGEIASCKHCAVSLTLHRTTNLLMCHYCQFEMTISHTCTECNADDLEFHGSGTQKVEELVNKLFTSANVIRMDVDTVRKRGAHLRILQKFADQKADILLGTQMIAKGLDFPNVTLVGVINGDSGLFLPDFRAGERTFQLLYQVCGRSGRHDKPGKAIIQTWNPQDVYIQAAAKLDIKKFYNIALAQRQELTYPPFSRVARILISGNTRSNVERTANRVCQHMQKIKNQYNILGPSPAPIEKIKEQWRYHIVIKSTRKSEHSVHNLIHKTLGTKALERIVRGVRVQVDVDPISLL